MFGAEIIEVGIGLAFSYFVISIICSGIVEGCVKLTKLRAKHMKQALGELLDDRRFTGFVKDLYEHHLIVSPFKDRLGDPTYIPSRHFALAVLDILGKNEKLSKKEQFKVIEDRILTIKDEPTKKRLLAMLRSSAYQVDNMRDKIEAWFNESMSGVSEWYRVRMRFWVSLVSVIVVGAMNADSVKMATMFWNDDELRTATVSAAESYVGNYANRIENGTAPTLVRTITMVYDTAGNVVDSTISVAPTELAVDTNVVRSIKSTLDTLYNDINATKVLPIGWGSEILPGHPNFNPAMDPVRWWITKILGLILTIGAVSLGSTYWYSQLKALLSFRLGRSMPEPTPSPAPAPPPTTAPAKEEEDEESDAEEADGESSEEA